MGEKKIKNSLVEGPITPEKIATSIAHHQVKTNFGGHDIFLGQVRADEIDGKTVTAIDYSAYDEMANKVFDEIREDAFEKFDLTNSGKKSYDYLTSMPLHNFTEEKWAELKEKRDIKKREWEELLEKTTEELWVNDLDICLNLNKIYNKNLEKDRREEKAKKTKSKKKGRKR